MQSDTYSTTPATDEVRDKAQQTASTLVDQAQQVATTQAKSQMTRAADTLETVASSIRQSTSSMREQQPQIATVADQAAARVDDASRYLREHDLNDVVRVAEDYARREPLMFLGAAFAIGFVAARFLRSAAPSGSTSSYRNRSGQYGMNSNSNYGMGTSYGRSYGSGDWSQAGGTAGTSGGANGGSNGGNNASELTYGSGSRYGTGYDTGSGAIDQPTDATTSDTWESSSSHDESA